MLSLILTLAACAVAGGFVAAVALVEYRRAQPKRPTRPTPVSLGVPTRCSITDLININPRFLT